MTACLSRSDRGSAPRGRSAKNRLNAISEESKAWVAKLESEEWTLTAFLRAVIMGLGEPQSGGKDNSLAVTSAALVYLRDRKEVNREWLIDLFERFGNLVYLRRAGGAFRRYTYGQASKVMTFDEPALVAELDKTLGAHLAHAQERSERTLFDKSIKRRTMRAGRYAKGAA